ncbi:MULTISPECIES: hypothetical protein [Paraburkholderia]|uniref:hypothetical protein n=1 Tax=Paraburkholderia TaxID=1822464 RepID=UPI0013A6FAD3|nr:MULTISPECIES: hypothetical protein [Paraburkholderia]MDH6147130.1 hypothetical protein [Paraburkholderia sp. WSM4179]
MRIADRIERRLLGMARALCLIALVGAILAMIALMFALGVPNKVAVRSDPSVSASEVLSSIAGSEVANDGLESGSVNGNAIANVTAAVGLFIPAPLNAVLGQDATSQPLLEAWLERVPQGDRQQFLDELSDIVAVAGQHAAAWEWDNRERYVAAAMNQYARVKIGRIEATEKAVQVARRRNAQLGSSLGTLLALTGFLILLLLLTAIERNTRKSAIERLE